MRDRLLLTTLTIFGLLVVSALVASIVITYDIIDQVRHHAYVVAEQYREGLSNGTQKNTATNETTTREASRRPACEHDDR